MSLADFRKDLVIELYNEAGQLVIAYKVYRAWVSEYVALDDLDASANAVAIQSITLQHEGWERDTSVVEPAEHQGEAPPHARHPACRVADAILGAQGVVDHVVSESMTAIAAGSGDLPVLATPTLVALMEAAACQALAPSPARRLTSVGSRSRRAASGPVAGGRPRHGEGRRSPTCRVPGSPSTSRPRIMSVERDRRDRTRHAHAGRGRARAPS